MATRQRAGASNKPPVIPQRVLPQQTDASPSGASDEVPRSTAKTSDVAHTLDSEAPAQVRFFGEQISYRNREERIAESAYLYAEARGFQPGYELEDWLRAEKDIDALLSGNADNGRR